MDNEDLSTSSAASRLRSLVGVVAIVVIVASLVGVAVLRGPSSENGRGHAGAGSGARTSSAPTTGIADARANDPQRPVRPSDATPIPMLASPTDPACAGMRPIAEQSTAAADLERMRQAADDVERWAGALHNDSDARVRAASLLVSQYVDRTRSAADVHARCGENQECLTTAFAEGPDASVKSAAIDERLASLAVGSSDPFVYATGYQACNGRALAVRPPSCQLVSASQWARLDPDNSIAWLHVAGEAAQRKDDEAVAEALRRAATARASEFYGPRIAAVLAAKLPEAGTSLDLDVAMLGVVHSWTLPPLSVPARYCAAAQLADNNRWQECDALANQLASVGSTLIERRFAIRLGERLRWSPERMASLRDETDALYQAQTLGIFSDLATDCRSPGRVRRTLLQIATGGEVGAASQAIAASGKRVEDLAGELRRGREVALAARNAEVASAAAAASATPYSAAPPPAR